MQDFKKLKVWQKSHDLTIAVYQVSKSFPKDERFGLTSQIRRAAVSIPANIAEGCGRPTGKDRARFFGIAGGSASETEYLLILSHDLNFIDKEAEVELLEKVREIKRMLTSLMSKME